MDVGVVGNRLGGLGRFAGLPAYDVLASNMYLYDPTCYLH